MFPVTAMDAAKYLSLAGSGVDAPTSRACLRRVGGVDFRQLTALPRELVLEELGEHSPTLVEDTSRKPPISLHHVADLEILDHDGAVALGVVVTELVTEMLPLPTDLPVKVGAAELRFLSVLGSFLPPRDSTLSTRKPLESLAVEAGGWDKLAVRVRDHVRNASVDSDDGPDLWSRVGNFNLADNRGEPLIAVSLEGASLGSAFDGSVDNGSEVAEFGEPQEVAVQPPSFGMWLGQAKEVSSSLLPPRSPSHPLETALPSLVQLDEELGTHVSRNIGEPRKLSAKFGQFVDLIECGLEDSLVPRTCKSHLPLFKSKVPEAPESTLPLPEPIDLSFGRVDAIAERLARDHGTTIVHPTTIWRAVPPRPEGRGFPAEIR
jgi:hypothetical protein